MICLGGIIGGSGVKIGIPLLARGVALLRISIPFSILNIIGGVIRLTQGDVYGRVPAYAGIAGVNIGLMMTGIGAIGASKSKHIVVAVEKTLKTITGHVIT